LEHPPHASQFNSSTHGLPYEGEGENIAWASGGLAYVLDEPVDITELGLLEILMESMVP